MQNLVYILSIVLPLLIALGLGFYTRKKNILSPEAIEGMKTFVVKFALPAMLFGLFFTAEFESSLLVFSATTFVLGYLGLGFGILVAKPFVKRSPMLQYMNVGWEVGLLGYALFALLFGAENLRYMALMDFGQVLFVFSGFFTLLYARNGQGLKESFKSLLKNPIPWSMLLGVAFAASGASKALEPSGIASLIVSICSFLSAPLSCLIFIVVGYGIEFNKKNIGTAVVSAILRTFVCSILCLVSLFVVGKFLVLSEAMRWAVIMFYLSPAPYVLTIFALNDQERADISMSLTMQTIVSISAFILIVLIRG
jgi:hypothetical protein